MNSITIMNFRRHKEFEYINGKFILQYEGYKIVDLFKIMSFSENVQILLLIFNIRRRMFLLWAFSVFFLTMGGVSLIFIFSVNYSLSDSIYGISSICIGLFLLFSNINRIRKYKVKDNFNFLEVIVKEYERFILKK